MFLYSDCEITCLDFAGGSVRSPRRRVGYPSMTRKSSKSVPWASWIVVVHASQSRLPPNLYILLFRVELSSSESVYFLRIECLSVPVSKLVYAFQVFMILICNRSSLNIPVLCGSLHKNIDIEHSWRHRIKKCKGWLVSNEGQPYASLSWRFSGWGSQPYPSRQPAH